MQARCARSKAKEIQMITLEVLGTKTEDDKLHEVAVFIPVAHIGYTLVKPEEVSNREVPGVLYAPVKLDDQDAREAIRRLCGKELYVFRMRYALEASFMWDYNVIRNSSD
jgi:hypothetical protein